MGEPFANGGRWPRCLVLRRSAAFASVDELDVGVSGDMEQAEAAAEEKRAAEEAAMEALDEDVWSLMKAPHYARHACYTYDIYCAHCPTLTSTPCYTCCTLLYSLCSLSSCACARLA